MSNTGKLKIVLLSLLLVTIAMPGSTRQSSLIILSEARGDVRLKRSRNNKYQRAYGGETLSPSDRLQLGRGSTATVLCNNSLPWTLESQGEFTVSSGCPASQNVGSVNGSGGNRIRTRASDNPTVPYLISPRNTIILEDKLILRWQAIEGARSYQVEVKGGGINWTTQVDKTEVIYSGNEPLQPDTRYRVMITADNRKSTRNEAPVGFTVLAEQEVQRVKSEISQLQQQPLSEEAKALALAYLYTGNELNTAAIELLEELIKKGTETTAVYELLGRNYQQVGLYRLARERFLTGLEKAKAEGNLDGQARIQFSLGEVDYGLAKLPQALQWFQAAQVSYRDLGNEGQVQELQQKVDDVKARLGL